MKLTLSKEHNPNYTAKIVKLTNGRKHENADRLKVFTIDFQNVITDLSYQDDEVVVFFPVESVINLEFLSWMNAFSDKDLNHDKEAKGFFNNKGRVKPIRLRGEKSEGFIIKMDVLKEYFGNFDYEVNQTFDEIGDKLICWKYVLQTKSNNTSNKSDKKKLKTENRVVDGQFRFHIDTENLRRNAFKINPNDLIGISYKLHGSSLIVSNILTKRKLKWYEKLFKSIGLNIKETEYDYIYSSRRVLKNNDLNKFNNHFYDDDIWLSGMEKVKHGIPKGYSLYGEIVGHTSTGAYIQSQYDYKCKSNELDVYIYRITNTNEDGFVIELDDRQIKEFCEKFGLNYLNTKFYYGYAKDLYPELELDEYWNENFVKNLERDYTNKDCFMCYNKVPEEGIVLRKASLFDYEAYKLKSFNFLLKESQDLDKGIIDMESEN